MTFNRNYFTLAALIFIIEVCIALFVKDKFVRPYVGDVLVIMLIYCFVQSFFKWNVNSVALSVLFFAFTIEFLQYLNIVEKLGLQHSSLARTVIGTSFAWYDIWAYVVGYALVLLIEKWMEWRTVVS
ncbi:MAG: DUF2809 domain-containing protein [Cyclobacteriaceae bacterium]|nr:DUF2809 domain-containing protein [Cyclobacteriaceae bacterium]